MKKFLGISLLALSLGASANCFELDKKSVKVEWKAFKTPAKAGVGGTFKKVNINTSNQAKSIMALVEKASFDIETQSVFTKNAARDKKIAKFFFSTMDTGTMITGKVQKIDKKKIVVAMTMNGKTVTVPMKYEIEDNELEAEGIVDVFDFALNDELAAINKACFAKHEGKTWNDVEIELKAKFKSCN